MRRKPNDRHIYCRFLNFCWLANRTHFAFNLISSQEPFFFDCILSVSARLQWKVSYFSWKSVKNWNEMKKACALCEPVSQTAARHRAIFLIFAIVSASFTSAIGQPHFGFGGIERNIDRGFIAHAKWTQSPIKMNLKAFVWFSFGNAVGRAAIDGPFLI